MTYYQILGVPQDASQDEIKKAFRRQAMECHPDQAQDMDKTEAKRRFIRLREAFDVLGDREKRKKYDRSRSGEEPETRARSAYEGDWENFSEDPESTIKSVIEAVLRGAADAATHTLTLWGGMLKWAFSYGLLIAPLTVVLIMAAAPTPPGMDSSVIVVPAVLFGIPGGMIIAASLYLLKFFYTGET